MDTLVQDVRHAIRALARNPGLSLLLALTFALGVAAVTSMYSVVDAVLFRPLAVPEPERVVSVYPTYPEWRTHERLSAIWQHGTFSYPELQEFRAEQKSYVAMGAYTWGRVTLSGEGIPEQVEAGFATPDLFTVLHTRPLLGRLFSDAEPPDAVLLAEGLWRRRFGAAESVVGRTLNLSGRTHTVIGVLSSDFELTTRPQQQRTRALAAAVWFPVVPGANYIDLRADNEFLTALARLRPDVTLEQADAEAGRLMTRLPSAQHLQHGGRVVGRVADQSNQFRLALVVLIAGALLLLLAATVSVAGMLLSAGIDRESELAIRSAMGAGRWRIARQLLTEGGLLGLIGGGLGIGLAAVMLRFLLRLAPAGMPGLARATLDLRVLALALAVSFAFTVLFSLVPALSLSRVDLSRAAGSARVTRNPRGRIQHGLSVAQLAVATLLLLGAGLLTRTMQHLNTVDPGFDPDSLLTVRIAPSLARFRSADPAEFNTRVSNLYEQIRQELQAIPGVEGVALTQVLPFSSDGGGNAIAPEGYSPRPGEVLSAERRFVSTNYFQLMRMRLVAGRALTAQDEHPAAARVLVVNEELVRRFWPGESGLGRRIRFWDAEPWTIVGVVSDPREFELRGERSMKFYASAKVGGPGGGSFIIRTRIEPLTIADAVRRRIWSVDPAAPITEVTTMRERMRNSITEQRYRTRLMLAFAALASVFAVTSFYGVLNRAVVRRRRELGIRSALGALRRDLMRLVVTHALRVAAAGLSIGLLAGYFATVTLESMLYETRRNDPLTLGAIALAMLGLTLLAAGQPAWRAARVEPMVVLRGD